MKKLKYPLIGQALCAVLLLAACKTTPETESPKKTAATPHSKPFVNKLKDQNGDQAFQSFLSRLRQVVAAHDVETLASMMTTQFGYALNPYPGLAGPGVFAYWDQNNLWPELQIIVREKFVPFGDETHIYMVAPAEFAANPETYAGYRAGLQLVNGSWKFAYFVNGVAEEPPN